MNWESLTPEQQAAEAAEFLRDHPNSGSRSYKRTGGHAARSHKRFAASAAERWMNCPGSIRLCESIPEPPPTSYALEGTQAHEILERALTDGLAEGPDDMVEAVRVAVDYVRRRVLSGCEMLVEQKFEIPHLPHVGGTADVALYHPGLLEIVDYKHGSGVAVEVEDNKQLSVYGLGILETARQWRIETVKLTIIQPRAFHASGPIRSWTTTPADLLDFHTDIEEAVARALEPDAPLIVGEAQCRWCPAKAICPARESMALVAAREAFEDVRPLALTLPLERISDILSKKALIEDWFEAVEQEGYRLAMSGVAIPGFKLVQPVGKRQWEGDVRSIADELAVLTKSLPDDFLVEKLIGVIEAEKKVKPFGKAALEKFNTLTVKSSSGKLQLVEENDKRPAVAPASQAFESVTYIPTGETA